MVAGLFGIDPAEDADVLFVDLNAAGRRLRTELQ
jgi:hypothetical protein